MFNEFQVEYFKSKFSLILALFSTMISSFFYYSVELGIQICCDIQHLFRTYFIAGEHRQNAKIYLYMCLVRVAFLKFLIANLIPFIEIFVMLIIIPAININYDLWSRNSRCLRYFSITQNCLGQAIKELC